MSTLSVLEKFEIGFLTTLVTLICTICISGLIVLFVCWFKKPAPKDSVAKGILKKKPTFQTKVAETYYLSEKDFTFDEDSTSTVNYSAYHSVLFEENKLCVNVDCVSIGGLNNPIKSLFKDFKQIYLRLLLNNNSSNSIINSERHPFQTRVDFKEAFIFTIKRRQSGQVAVVIEVFSNFINSDKEYLLGWVEIIIPPDYGNLPFRESRIMQTPKRLIDQYWNSVGYICISLCNFHDQIKLGLLATEHSFMHQTYSSLDNSIIYFTINVTGYQIEPYNCTTHVRRFQHTIIWNDIFLFNIPNEHKKTIRIQIFFWKGPKNLTVISEYSKIIGFINIGLDDLCTIKSQMHLEYILNNPNEDISKWYIIKAQEKEELELDHERT